MPYLLIALAIMCLSASQVLQKLVAGNASNAHGFLRGVVVQPLFWAALVLLGIGLCAWLTVLVTVEISQAYPLLSMTFVVTTIYAYYYLGEAVSKTRWIGIALICSGVGLMNIQ